MIRPAASLGNLSSDLREQPSVPSHIDYPGIHLAQYFLIRETLASEMFDDSTHLRGAGLGVFPCRDFLQHFGLLLTPPDRKLLMVLSIQPLLLRASLGSEVLLARFRFLPQNLLSSPLALVSLIELIPVVLGRLLRDCLSERIIELGQSVLELLTIRCEILLQLRCGDASFLRSFSLLGKFFRLVGIVSLPLIAPLKLFQGDLDVLARRPYGISRRSVRFLIGNTILPFPGPSSSVPTVPGRNRLLH